MADASGPTLIGDAAPVAAGWQRAAPSLLCLAACILAALLWRSAYGLPIATAALSLVAAVVLTQSPRAGAVIASVGLALALISLPLLVVGLWDRPVLLPERLAESLAVALLLAAAVRLAVFAPQPRVRRSRRPLWTLAAGSLIAWLVWVFFSFAAYVAGEGGIVDATRLLLGLCLLAAVLALVACWSAWRWPLGGALLALIATVPGYVGIALDASANRLALALIWSVAAVLLVAGALLLRRDAVHRGAPR